MLYENTDVHARRWPDLTDPETGRSLELEPRARVELDLIPRGENSEGFFDPFLKPVVQKSKAAERSVSEEQA